MIFGYNFIGPGSRDLFIICHKSGMYAVLVIEYKWTFGKLVYVSSFYFTETLPAGIGIGHSIIIVSLSVVLLILVVDKRQDRHIDEITQTQHKMPRPLIALTKAALEKQITIFTS